MRGPDAQSYRPQFEHWLSLGASHRDAYERAGEIFALGRFLASQREEIEAETNDNEPVGHGWKWVAIAASLLLAIGAGGWFANSQMRGRSEEHTSELQSLMRISYAVFCLKKKKKQKTKESSNIKTKANRTTENKKKARTTETTNR